jgi:hypothetical protein
LLLVSLTSFPLLLLLLLATASSSTRVAAAAVSAPLRHSSRNLSPHRPLIIAFCAQCRPYNTGSRVRSEATTCLDRSLVVDDDAASEERRSETHCNVLDAGPFVTEKASAGVPLLSSTNIDKTGDIMKKPARTMMSFFCFFIFAFFFKKHFELSSFG